MQLVPCDFLWHLFSVDRKTDSCKEQNQFQDLWNQQIFLRIHWKLFKSSWNVCNLWTGCYCWFWAEQVVTVGLA